MSTGHDGAALAAVERLAESCAVVLGSSLVSAIVHGSLTQEDFRPGKSDLDLLLVVEQELTRNEADELVRAVESADLATARGIDLLVVTRQAASDISEDAPARELLVGRWPGSDEELEIERAESQTIPPAEVERVLLRALRALGHAGS